MKFLGIFYIEQIYIVILSSVSANKNICIHKCTSMQKSMNIHIKYIHMFFYAHFYMNVRGCKCICIKI